MKKLTFLLLGSVLLLSSCGIHIQPTLNLNNHNTEVVLTKKNYTVLAKVSGESEATYIFGIGGLRKQAMIAEARAQMLTKADILGGSKAIINETFEIKHTFFPFVRKYKVTVSGHIIEFTE